MDVEVSAATLFKSMPSPQPRFCPYFPFLIGWQGLGWGWVRFQRIGLLQSHFQLLELNNGGEGVWGHQSNRSDAEVSAGISLKHKTMKRLCIKLSAAAY